MRVDLKICKQNRCCGREFGRVTRWKKAIQQNGLTSVMQKSMDADLDAKYFMQTQKSQ